ncbi:hypothetical protein D3C84_825810 [compost metagenome]
MPYQPAPRRDQTRVEQQQDNTPLTYKKANSQLGSCAAIHCPLRGCVIHLGGLLVPSARAFLATRRRGPCSASPRMLYSTWLTRLKEQAVESMDVAGSHFAVPPQCLESDAATGRGGGPDIRVDPVTQGGRARTAPRRAPDPGLQVGAKERCGALFRHDAGAGSLRVAAVQRLLRLRSRLQGQLAHHRPLPL